MNGKKAIITTDIDKAIEVLNNDGIIGMPTETVYGLAGYINSNKAINKIYETKKRPNFNPLIVHIGSINQLESVAVQVPAIAYRLCEKFWPGSLTLVLKKHPSISYSITGGKETVAVRMPAHNLALDLINRSQLPIAAPSANPFGSISPTSALHVYDYFKDDLEIILDGGSCIKGIESTIIGFDSAHAVLYRHGSLDAKEIEKISGRLNQKTSSVDSPESPGMLSKHYSPTTKLLLVDNIEEAYERYKKMNIGFIIPLQNMSQQKFQHTEILSHSNNIYEAASNLYAAMHRLDKLHLDLILALRVNNAGIGSAINDRLERASR